MTRREATAIRRAEELATKAVNNQIIVTHRSASRGSKRPAHDVFCLRGAQ